MDERVIQDLEGALNRLTRTIESTFNTIARGGKESEGVSKKLLVLEKKRLAQEVQAGRISQGEMDQTLASTASKQKNVKATGKVTKGFKGLNKILSGGIIGKLLGGLKSLATGAIKTAANFAMAGNEIKGFQDALSGFDGISIMGMKLSDLGKAADFNVGIFKQLSQSGAGFGKSVINMRRAATEANMPILDFVNLVKDNTEQFAGLFGTVQDGMPAIAAFNRELRTRTQNELAEFGLNLEDTTEFLNTQLEIQRATGQAEKIGSMDMVSITTQYAKNLTKLSKMTGVSVKELDKQNKANALDGTFQATLAGMDKEQADRIRNQVAMLDKTNPGMAKLVREMTAFGVPVSDSTKGLAVMSPQLIEAARNFTAGGGSVEDFVSAQRKAGNELSTAQAKALAQAGMLGKSGIGETMNTLASAAGATTVEVEKQMAAEGDATKKIVAFGDDIDTLKVQAERLSTEVFGKILNSQALDDILGNLSSTIKGEQTVGSMLMKAFDGSLGAIKTVAVSAYKKGKEFVTAGKDKKNLGDNLFGWMGYKSKAQKQIQRQESFESAGGGSQFKGPKYQQGTGGEFVNFGGGTGVELHGREAVVPEKSVFGSLLSGFQKIQKAGGAVASAAKGAIGDAVSGGGGGGADLSQLLAGINAAAENTSKASLDLNKLVAINMATERNTKIMVRELAGGGGDLI